MFPDQGPEPAAPLLADEDVAAVAVGEAAEAVVAAGALVVAKTDRRAVGVRGVDGIARLSLAEFGGGHVRRHL